MIPSGRTEFLIKAFEVGKNEFCGKKEGCRVVIDSGHVLTTGPKAFVQYMRHVTSKLAVYKVLMYTLTLYTQFCFHFIVYT